MSTTYPERPADGFAIVSAIFILVVLAALAGFVVSVTTTQNLTFAQDVQGTRAYQAARAGLDWGIGRWLNSAACSGPEAYVGTPPTCGTGTVSCSQRTLYDPPGSNLAGLEGFRLVVATCVCPAPPAGGICQITATASSGAAGMPGHVERQLRATVEGS